MSEPVIYKGIVSAEEILLYRVSTILRNLQLNVPLLKELIKQKDPYKRDAILNSVTQKGIKTVLGFPRQAFEIPCVVVTVANTQEDTILGDDWEAGQFTQNTDLIATTGTSISFKDGSGTVIPIHKDSSSLPIPETGVILLDEEYISYESGSDTQITLRSRAILNSDRSTHDPVPIIFIQQERVRGSYEAVTMRIDCLDDNGDMVIFLGNLIRAALRGNAQLLHQDGLIELNLSTSDYAGRPEFIPNEIYMRTVIVNCKYGLTFPLDALVALVTDLQSSGKPPIGGPRLVTQRLTYESTSTSDSITVS